MRILIWTHHPGDLLGEAINFLTHGPAQHAGFLRQNGMIHEAYLPRVRDRAPVADELPFIKSIVLEGCSPYMDGLFEGAFDRALGVQVRYSVADLFRFLFNQPNVDESHTFCSRYVMHQIMTVAPSELWPLVRCMGGGDPGSDDWVSPRDLFISPRLRPGPPVTLLNAGT